VLRPEAAAQKGEFVVLLHRATTSAADRGLIGDRPTAAVDATGLESRHTSRYFFKRAGRKHTSRLWTKVTVAVDTDSHFLAGARVTAGPSNDSPQFKPVVAQASLAVTWDRVLADAAFDSEAHHRYCREDLRVRATVIPLNRRGQGRRWPKTKFRRQMVKRFRRKPRGSRRRRVFGQRWQAESAFSRHKRRLGSALGARSDAARERECQLRVLTHNLMLLAAHG
jgi:transposase